MQRKKANHIAVRDNKQLLQFMQGQPRLHFSKIKQRRQRVRYIRDKVGNGYAAILSDVKKKGDRK